ncbi:DUF1471 domain-containing protein [Enterobacteriaceae bacterium H11S18]|uniref:DUF1471 domain-containing protein n=1 Tax=Dryocola clanedunensis TaxID=2925396 RepID=UPI0022F03B02|nr:DUF1471 domain-containing protein [Dryocola clanedunensis]MCT4712580.1 DUF1471 domain-containing protein [Dryocola clanedunensis]
MKKLMIAAFLTFPVIAFAAQPEQGYVLETQGSALHFSQDTAGTVFVTGTLVNNLDYNGQASLTESKDIAAVLVPSMANELTRKQAANAEKIGVITADGSTPDDVSDALMVKAEQQGASGYRITSVTSNSPFYGTATLYR